MIQFLTQRTTLPTGSAAGRRRRIKTAAFVGSVTLIAQILSACSSQSAPATSAAAQYPDLTDPPAKHSTSARRCRSSGPDKSRADPGSRRPRARRSSAASTPLGRFRRCSTVTAFPVVFRTLRKPPRSFLQSLIDSGFDIKPWEPDR